MAKNENVRLYYRGSSSSTLENLFLTDGDGDGDDDDDDEDESEFYSIYFKGLARAEGVDQESSKISVVRIGVVICDSMDNLVFELGKATRCRRRPDTSPLEAKLEALIEALMAAQELNIKNLFLFCKSHGLYNWLNTSLDHDTSSSTNVKEEGLKIETQQESELRKKIEKVKSLREKLKRGTPCLLMESKTKRRHKHASKLAREADSSSAHVKIVKETCGICLEPSDILHMLSVHHCFHKRCKSCVKKHIEVKLREGTLPGCPHEGCKSRIKISACKKILSRELGEVLEQRVKESHIPVLERIYCPYPKCSNLMSKGEVLKYSKYSSRTAEESGYRRCLKCQDEFCVDCKVPWHSGMTCFDYKKLHPYSCAEEEKLISLAQRYSWRQCMKCSQLIELAAGCYHIICRCGYQFCYTCGMEWKKDKACGCPLWNERLIIY